MKIFNNNTVKFTPRDIGMWRTKEHPVPMDKYFKSFNDFMRWVDTKTTVRLDDGEYPFKLEYQPSKNRFVVIQWTVIGWIEIE